MYSRQLARIHEGLVVAVEPNIRGIVNEEFSLTSFDEAVASRRFCRASCGPHRSSTREKPPRTAYVVDTKGVWI